MAAKKEIFTPAEPQGTPCAADPACRYFGRLWTRKLQHHERICVDHYIAAVNQDSSLAGERVIPPARAAVIDKKLASAGG